MSQQWDMSNLEIYKVPCKDCSNCILTAKGPVKSTDINPKTGKGPLTKNIGKYYFACDKSGCNYFRWHSTKWAKFISENPSNNSINANSNTDTMNENKFIDEFQNIVSNLENISLEMVDYNTKIILKSKLETLINKLINSQEIPKQKFDKYLKITTEFIGYLN